MKIEPKQDQQVELLTSFIYVWMTEGKDRRTMNETHNTNTTQPLLHRDRLLSSEAKCSHQTLMSERPAKERAKAGIVLSALHYLDRIPIVSIVGSR